jgi:lipoprotein-anchoring transpeptidase ErfK/SrfK
MNDWRSDPQARNFLAQSYQALKAGNRQQARQLAVQAIQTAPDLEEPWLILAAISEPSESIRYLSRALELNPQSERARKGMHWAVQRMRTVEHALPQPAKSSTDDTGRLILPNPPPPSDIPTVAIKPKRTSKPGQSTGFVIIKWLSISIIFLLVILAIVKYTDRWEVSVGSSSVSRPVNALLKPSLTPTKPATPTLTPTATTTSTVTVTATATYTPIPPTRTLKPTKKTKPTREPPDTPTPDHGGNDGEQNNLEENSESSDTNSEDDSYSPPVAENIDENRWIDVDLSNQMAYAYEGNDVVRSFVVSTGTWQYPTVTGQFRIYVMYRYADMTGPGYHLPDVPYVMYFYEGYGLHGTYWHNNFGTPMSHGCVNFSIPDAGWLFNWSSIGTLVNVHY